MHPFPLALCLLACTGPGHAHDTTAPLAHEELAVTDLGHLSSLEALRRSQPGTPEAKAALEGLEGVPLEVLSLLAGELDLMAPKTPRPEAGWSAHEATDAHGVTRPYQLYVPATVAEGGPMKALVMHLHGAVGRPEFGTGLGSLEACGYAPLLWPELADAHGLVIAAPQGRDDCTWWSQPGHDHVHAVLRDVRRQLLVPQQGVIGAGFSDGGSGCFHFAMTEPDAFSGFIALNGHPAVASLASDDHLDLRNLASTPILAATTHLDTLYPSRYVIPHLSDAIEHGAELTLLAVPNVGHQPAYFGDQHAAIMSFIEGALSAEPRRRVRWTHSDGVSPRHRGIELLEFGDTTSDAAALEPLQHMTRPGRIRLGVQLASGSSTLAEVEEGELAHQAGLRAGDRIDELGDVEVTDSRSLRAALRTLRHDTPFQLVRTRDGVRDTFEARVPAFEPSPIYRTDAARSFVDASWNQGDQGVWTCHVVSRGVRSLRLDLPADAQAKSITVNWNGAPREVPVQETTRAALLEHLQRSGEASSHARRFVKIEG